MGGRTEGIYRFSLNLSGISQHRTPWQRMASLLCLLSAVCYLAPLALGTPTQEEKQTRYMKRTGQKYLDNKAKEEGVKKLPGGMLYEALKTGTPFDSGTTSFAPNQVIKGWTVALQLMCEGDKWRLHIPYDMGYGESGSPPKIPGYAPLVFDVEIHKVKGKGKTCDSAKKN